MACARLKKGYIPITHCAESNVCMRYVLFGSDPYCRKSLRIETYVKAYIHEKNIILFPNIVEENLKCCGITPTMNICRQFYFLFLMRSKGHRYYWILQTFFYSVIDKILLSN